MIDWGFASLLGMLAHGAWVARQNHCTFRRHDRRCLECGSENVDRLHTMKHEINTIYWTETKSVCRDCGTVRIDKSMRPKLFKKFPDLYWRRWVYQQQFARSGQYSIKERMQYWEGDFPLAQPMRDYFGSPRGKKQFSKKPPLPTPILKIESMGNIGR